MPTSQYLRGGVIGATARALGVEVPQVCTLHHRHKWTPTGIITGGPPSVPDTVFVGTDGQPQRISPQLCEQENRSSLDAEEAAYQQSVAASQQAAEDANRKHSAALAQTVRAEEARGYKRVSVKELYLDSKSYAASGLKVAVRGFYKASGRHDERLYSSYDDFMMHTFQNVEALYIGLVTENGSRSLREALLSCQAGGCNATILGHVDRCVATNVFGASSQDVCLVAEDIGAPEN